MSCRHLLYGDWDYDEFREKHLQKYLSMCKPNMHLHVAIMLYEHRHI